MNDSRKWKGILLVILALIPILYVSGFLAQMLQNYAVWISSGGIPGDGTSPELPKTDILICLLHVFSMYGLKTFCMISGVAAVFFVMLWIRDKEDGKYYDQERNFKYSKKGTYGTAKFLSVKEMREFLDVTSIKETTGTILGSRRWHVISIPENTFMNKHIAVYGASGSMKSRAFVRNMIFQAVARGECIVVTDPKAELYEDMSIYLEDNGYTVRVFNLVHPECSDRWDCLSMVHGDEIQAQICVEIIFTNTGDLVDSGFWSRGETNLLKALILYVDMEKNREDRNMGAVYEMILERTDQELENLFSILPKAHPAKKPYNIYRKSDVKVRSDMMAGLGTRLQVFQSQKICDATAADDFVFNRMGWEKYAYFVIMSDQDGTFRFLSSLFFSSLFIELVRSADDKTDERTLPIGVNFILDEFTQIGKIPDFNMKISTVRSRNIRISVIFQSIAQLDNRYPRNEWLEILGNCDTQIALGCNDPITAKFLSDRSGITTVEAVNESRDLNTWRFSDHTPEYKETKSEHPRNLMNPGEIMKIPMNEALIILRTKNVFKVKKFDYTKHPESKKMKKRKAVMYIPEWRKSQADPENVVKNVENDAKRVMPDPEQPKKKVFRKIEKQNVTKRNKEDSNDR